MAALPGPRQSEQIGYDGTKPPAPPYSPPSKQDDAVIVALSDLQAPTDAYQPEGFLKKKH